MLKIAFEAAKQANCAVAVWRLPNTEDINNKNIIVDSLKFLVTEDKATINAFVIMNNHLHIIW